jgi:hypothetical protein
MKDTARTVLSLLLAVLSCLGLTAWVYWPGLAGDFVLDDFPNIVDAYVDPRNIDAAIYTITHNGSGMLGRSVSILSFMFTALQFGIEPWGYKFHNLLLHLLNGLLLFRLLHLVLPRLDRSLTQQQVLVIGGLTASLWLIHPLQVSTVMYVVQRMAMLSCTFTLLALLVWMKVRLAPHRGWQFYVWGWLVFPFLCLCALLSKELGALIPVFLLGFELLVFRADIRQYRQDRAMAMLAGIAVYLPLLLGSVLLLVKFDALTDYTGRMFSLSERLLTQVHVIFFYVRLIFLPRIKDMSLFHDDYPVTTGLDLATLFLILVLVLACTLAWRLRHRAVVVAFGLSWFLTAHLLESTVFPLELVFEHRNYMAMAGLILVPVYFAVRYSLLRQVAAISPLVIIMLMFMTRTRAAEWGDPALFHAMAIADHPLSGRAITSYVNSPVARNDVNEVIGKLYELQALTPNEPGVNLHIQIIFCGSGYREEAGLMRSRELLGRYPVSVYGLNALQNLLTLIANEKCPEVPLDEYEQLLDTAFAFEANQRNAHNYSNLQRLRGIVRFHQGFYAQGVVFYRLAHETSGRIDTLAELMLYQVAAGQFGDAEDTLAVMDAQNQQRFGIDTYQVEISRRELEAARSAALQADNP